VVAFSLPGRGHRISGSVEGGGVGGLVGTSHLERRRFVATSRLRRHLPRWALLLATLEWASADDAQADPIAAAFEKLDLNLDGVIDRNEYLTVARQSAAAPQKEADPEVLTFFEEMFVLADVDGSGSLIAEEVVLLTQLVEEGLVGRGVQGGPAARRQPRSREVRRMFERVDLNFDERIDRGELLRAFQHSAVKHNVPLDEDLAPHVDEIFLIADVDKSNFLDLAEAKIMTSVLMELMAEGANDTGRGSPPVASPRLTTDRRLLDDPQEQALSEATIDAIAMVDKVAEDPLRQVVVSDFEQHVASDIIALEVIHGEPSSWSTEEVIDPAGAEEVIDLDEANDDIVGRSGRSEHPRSESRRQRLARGGTEPSQTQDITQIDFEPVDGDAVDSDSRGPMSYSGGAHLERRGETSLMGVDGTADARGAQGDDEAQSLDLRADDESDILDLDMVGASLSPR